MLRSVIVGCLAGTSLASCTLQRAEIAEEAREGMLGLDKETVLSCMGAPAAEHEEGDITVWQYHSGGELKGGGYYTSGNYTYGGPEYRDCTVDVHFTDGKVSRLGYRGNTGGLLSGDEQCGYVLEECEKYF